MKLRCQQSIVILCAIGVLFCAGYWMLQEQEPMYQGKTAQEWFDARIAGRVTDDVYMQSLRVLDTNFFPVLTNALDLRLRLTERVYQKAPHWVQDRCQFFVTKRQQRSIHAHDTFANWRNIRGLEPEVKKLKAILASSEYAFQNQYAFAICMAETGNTNFSIKPNMQYLSHPEFIVRFHVSKLLTQSTGGKNEVQLQCVPVLLEAVTNSVLVLDNFGKGARAVRRTALERIRRISPETADKYSAFIK